MPNSPEPLKWIDLFGIDPDYPDPEGDAAKAVAEAVAELTAMTNHGDTESDHGRADDLLLRFVPAEVAEAYTRAQERVGFW